MQQKSIFQYFLKGFSFANQSFDIFIITLFFGSSIYLPDLSGNLQIDLLYGLLFLILMGFNLSLPVFLIQKQQKQKLNYGEILKVIVNNTMRLLIPGIILFIILVLLVITSFVLVGLFLQPSNSQVTNFFKNIGQPGPQPIFMLLIAPLTFLAFTPFFFSLENKNLLISIKQSIQVSFKNLYFIGILMVINIIYYFLISFLPSDFWGSVVTTVLAGYTTLFLTTSTLFYYQARVQKGV